MESDTRDLFLEVAGGICALVGTFIGITGENTWDKTSKLRLTRSGLLALTFAVTGTCIAAYGLCLTKMDAKEAKKNEEAMNRIAQRKQDSLATNESKNINSIKIEQENNTHEIKTTIDELATASESVKVELLRKLKLQISHQQRFNDSINIARQKTVSDIINSGFTVTSEEIRREFKDVTDRIRLNDENVQNSFKSIETFVRDTSKMAQLKREIVEKMEQSFSDKIKLIELGLGKVITISDLEKVIETKLSKLVKDSTYVVNKAP